MFLPHCSVSTRHVTAPVTSVAPMKSKCAACLMMSRGEHLVRLAPRGGEDLTKKVTAMTETPVIGRLMKKHQHWTKVMVG